MVVVNAVNIAVSWSLLLGAGPLPELGWDALPAGAACGHLAGGLLPTIVLLRGRGMLRLNPSALRPDLHLIRRILRISVPAGIDLLSIVGCQLAFLSVINRLGKVATAAHGVALRIESLAYMPGNAFQVAAATMAGQYLGARNHRQATRSVLVACAFGSALLGVAGVLLYVFADVLVGWFLRSDQREVAAQAAPLLRIVSVALVPLAVLMVLSGALRGAGDTRWPLVFTFVGLLGIRLPATWLLAHTLGWGVAGAWYAMVFDLVLRCVLVTLRFWQGAWRRIEV
jgi:putative MATE family efflux protein